MALPLSYNIRNLVDQETHHRPTASGMALVVVFAAILMLAQGLQKTLVRPAPTTT